MSSEVIETTQQPTAAGVQEGTTPSSDAPGMHDQHNQDDALAEQSDQGEGQHELDAEGEDAEVEREWNGKKYLIPKAVAEVADRIEELEQRRKSMEGDYTRKTQEAAEVARATQAQIAKAQQELQLQAQVQRENLAMYARAQAMDEQIAQYRQANWQQLAQADPAAAQQAWIAFEALKDQRAQLGNEIGQRETQARQRFQQEQAQTQARTVETVRSIVSGWSKEDREAVNEVGAKVYGVTQEHFGFFAGNPGLLPILRDAVRWQQAQKRAAAAGKPPPAAPVAPTRTVSAGGNERAGKSLDDRTSTDEWMRQRNEQLSRRRR